MAIRAASGADREDEVWEGVYVLSPMPKNECQDVVGTLSGINRDTSWLGDPDFAVVIISPDDRACDQLPCSSQIGVRELLVTDRDPGAREWYRLQEGHLLSYASWNDRAHRRGRRHSLGGGPPPRVGINFPGCVSVGTSSSAQPDVPDSTVVPPTFRRAPGAARPRIEGAHADGEPRGMVEICPEARRSCDC